MLNIGARQEPGGEGEGEKASGSMKKISWRGFRTLAIKNHVQISKFEQCAKENKMTPRAN